MSPHHGSSSLMPRVGLLRRSHRTRRIASNQSRLGCDCSGTTAIDSLRTMAWRTESGQRSSAVACLMMPVPDCRRPAPRVTLSRVPGRISRFSTGSAALMACQITPAQVCKLSELLHQRQAPVTCTLLVVFFCFHGLDGHGGLYHRTGSLYGKMFAPGPILGSFFGSQDCRTAPARGKRCG